MILKKLTQTLSQDYESSHVHVTENLGQIFRVTCLLPVQANNGMEPDMHLHALFVDSDSPVSVIEARCCMGVGCVVHACIMQQPCPAVNGRHEELIQSPRAVVPGS